MAEPSPTTRKMPGRGERRRFSRGDWLEIGLTVLGNPAVETNVEEICTRAGKTVGGFYFHFKGIDDYLVALAQLWRERFTGDLIRATRAAAPPAKRLDLLNYLAIHLDVGVEQGIRRLAAREPAIADLVSAVDRQRTDYLAELYEASGRYTPRQAQSLARIEYAAFVGMQLTETATSASDLLALYDDFLELTGRRTRPGG